MWYEILIAFLSTVVLGKITIKLLKKYKVGQTVREDGPETHLVKSGTLTMGGLFFLIPIFVLSLIFTKFNMDMIVMVVTSLLFMLIGFADDLIKVVKKSKDGLSAKGKTVFAILISTLFAVYIVYFSNIGSNIYLPFSKMQESMHIPELIYIPIIVLVLNAITNTTNLSDGVDGLASSIGIVVLLFFGVVAVTTGVTVGLPLVYCTIGGLLGFLVYNTYPATVFMGDTGSFGLGGIIGVISIYMGIPWILIIVGIIYVIEAISVMIQVGYYKKTKKRFFKKAPIHHHFELVGWKEPTVVLVFAFVTLVGGVLSYYLLGLF